MFYGLLHIMHKQYTSNKIDAGPCFNFWQNACANLYSIDVRLYIQFSFIYSPSNNVIISNGCTYFNDRYQGILVASVVSQLLHNIWHSPQLCLIIGVIASYQISCMGHYNLLATRKLIRHTHNSLFNRWECNGHIDCHTW